MLFTRGHAADLILLVMLAEWVVLRVRGWPIATATVRLLPGACLVVALRLALTGADWRWVALATAASLPPHLADLKLGAPRRRAGSR